MDMTYSNPSNRLRELALEGVSSLYVVFVVLFFWSKPVIAFVLLAAGLGMQLFFWEQKIDAAVMIVAALIGAPSEVLCVRLNIWWYHAPGLFLGVPIWLPFVWAFLICLFRRISLTVYAVIHSRGSHDSPMFKLLFGVLAAVIVAYYTITVVAIAKKFAIIFSIFMVLAAFFWHTRKDILLFITGAVLGTFGEYLCMRLGFWHYQFPIFTSIGMPLSLPLAWGLSSVLIVNIAGKFVRGDESG